MVIAVMVVKNRSDREHLNAVIAPGRPLSLLVSWFHTHEFSVMRAGKVAFQRLLPRKVQAFPTCLYLTCKGTYQITGFISRLSKAKG